MANAIYPIYKQAILTSASTNFGMDVNTVDDGPYAVLIDTGTYTYSAAHDFFNDLSGVVGAASGVRITNPTVTTGLFDGDNIVFSAVTGATVEAIVIYRHNAGANTTWKLFCFIDTSVTGLPVTPNGGDINLNFNASGIVQV